jgi:hypothetical protein
VRVSLLLLHPSFQVRLAANLTQDPTFENHFSELDFVLFGSETFPKDLSPIGQRDHIIRVHTQKVNSCSRQASTLKK